MSLDISHPFVWEAERWCDTANWSDGSVFEGMTKIFVPGNKFRSVSIAASSEIDAVWARPNNSGKPFLISPANPLPDGPWEGPLFLTNAYGKPIVVNTSGNFDNGPRLHDGVDGVMYSGTQKVMPRINASSGTAAQSWRKGPYLALVVHSHTMFQGVERRAPWAGQAQYNTSLNPLPTVSGSFGAWPFMGRKSATIFFEADTTNITTFSIQGMRYMGAGLAKWRGYQIFSAATITAGPTNGISVTVQNENFEYLVAFGAQAAGGSCYVGWSIED